MQVDTLRMKLTYWFAKRLLNIIKRSCVDKPPREQLYKVRKLQVVQVKHLPEFKQLGPVNVGKL